MSSYVLGFRDIDRSHLGLAGGKGANLGELSQVEGLRVPDGFCISTAAFARILEEAPGIGDQLDQLSRLTVGDRERLQSLSADMRRLIEGVKIPKEIEEEIIRHFAELGEDGAFAVRSSATAEDLPTASFAGQQDTYLNVVGREAVLRDVSRCWASLFTERAVTYRIQNGFDHRQVRLAVVVQKMVRPEAAGIMFTADPVTANRKVVSIDAGFGLGEALVSGLVNADVYKVRDGQVIERAIAAKKLAIEAAPEGGTIERRLEPEEQTRPVLTDAQVLELAEVGRRIEAHFGRPQDIEWCLVDGAIHIVQSRPITTLFPIPEAADQENHVYVSVGHQQMMTDAIKPLGLSFFQLMAGRPMMTAGGRLFVDVTRELASPSGRHMLVNVLGKSDPLIRDALTTVLDRNFIPPDPVTPEGDKAAAHHARFEALNDYGPEVVAELIEKSRRSVEALKEAIAAKTGPALFDFIQEDIQASKKANAESPSLAVIMSGMNAASWINEKMMEWLGEKNAADTLTQSVPNNITSEMGLALLDVADVVRPHPQVIDYLRQVDGDDTLEGLLALEGGREVYDAIFAYLDTYGMRCAGEIDITRTRWREKPTTLVPLILSNIRNFEPHASRRKFEQGRQEALDKKQELLERLKQLPDGEQKAEETERMIRLVRDLSGYREYPKYGIVSRYFVYKQALMREADRLVESGVLGDRDDVFYLTFQEFQEVVRTHQLDPRLIAERKDAFQSFEKMSPPRILTSEGEVITGRYNRENLPAGAIVGLPVSSGLVEGRARVISNLEEANLEEGDILVTAFTDPSWTPLFVSIKGLVTEVGGLMTHGAVIAREYGLPAVVGVEHATTLIQDGQRIRVHGTEGYIEIL